MIYDIIIIGAGPAGLTAAIYAGRARMKTLLLSDVIPGGQVMLTEAIENYPGFKALIKGPELMNNMYEQAKKLEIEFQRLKAKNISKEKDGFLVKTEKGEFKGLSLIIATGASYKVLGVKGENEFVGKGVSYCGVCDAPLFKNKEIAIIGGGDTAVYEAMHLLKFCSKLHIVHRRDRFRATKIMQERILENKKTVMHWNSTLEEIYGSKLVEGIKIKDVENGNVTEVPSRGVFIFVGIKPNSEMVKGFLKTDKKECILANENMETSCRGIFACGDVRKKILRQISTAVGDGAQAAFSAQQFVEELKGIAYPPRTVS